MLDTATPSTSVEPPTVLSRASEAGAFGLPSRSFDELSREISPRIYRFVLRRVSDPHEAEDLTQDVLLQVWLSLDRYEGRSPFTTWVLGIAHHRVCTRYRRKRLQLVALDESHGAVASREPPIDRCLGAARVLAQVESVLSSEASDVQREVFDLRYRENLSVKMIAHRLDKSVGAVKASLLRARRTLERNVPDLEAVLAP